MKNKLPYYPRPNRKGCVPWNKGQTKFSLFLKCDFCNKEFKASPAKSCRKNKGKKIACSKECQYKLISLMFAKIRVSNTACSFCGKSIWKSAGALKKAKSIYCSKQCQGKAKQKDNGSIVKCFNCGKRLNRSNSRLDNSQKQFCSPECQHAVLKPPLMIGENHPAWVGGYDKKGYPRDQWTETLKLSIRQRDGFKCRVCGVPELECETNLDVHHIDYNKQNNDPQNLIALCHSCHSKTNIHRDNWILLLSR